MSSLDDKIQAARQNSSQIRGPVWKGPEQDGITFSLLSRFLCCRERFRILVVEGLRPRDDFSSKMHYGNMWHVCEEHHRVTQDDKWLDALADYVGTLSEKYPMRRDQIAKWAQVCAIQFPVYLDKWASHQDTIIGTNLMREVSFDVPYRLPSGRTVKLRGKWDSVDFLPAHEDEGRRYPDGIWLQENKTKGDINPVMIRQQLRFDLQTMIYLTALEFDKVSLNSKPVAINDAVDCFGEPILGVRYNVIRRPLSGGRHTIVQHKPSKSKPHGESEDEYFVRLMGLIQGEPDYFFMRWKSEVTPQDVAIFRRECLDPILTDLCQWWDKISATHSNISNGHKSFSYFDLYSSDDIQSVHWRAPFGVWNPLMEGGATELDEYLYTGSTAGLQRTDNLFPELS